MHQLLLQPSCHLCLCMMLSETGPSEPIPCIKLKCSSQLLLFSGLLSTAHPASWNHAEIELFCIRPAFQSLVCDTPLPPFLVWFGFFQVVSNAVEMKQRGMKGCFWVNRGGCPLLSQSHCSRFTWIREELRMKRGTAIPLIRALILLLSLSVPLIKICSCISVSLLTTFRYTLRVLTSPFSLSSTLIQYCSPKSC